MSVKTSNLFEMFLPMFLPSAAYLCRRMCCTVENKKSRLSPDNRLFKTNYLKTNLLKQIKKILVLNEYPLITHCFICIYGTSLWMPNISIS